MTIFCSLCRGPELFVVMPLPYNCINNCTPVIGELDPAMTPMEFYRDLNWHQKTPVRRLAICDRTDRQTHYDRIPR